MRVLYITALTLLTGCSDEQTPAHHNAADDTGATPTRNDTATPADTAPTDTAALDTGEPFPAGARVLDHVTVVDADTVREDAAVVLVGDEIWDVVDAGQDWPEGAVVDDWQGATVIPGLIDAHVHLFLSGATWWVGDPLAANLEAQLAWGVVGVADLGAPVEVFDLRDRIEDGSIIGPRIFATGPFLTAVGSHPCETVNDPALCRYVDGDGADAVAELADSNGVKVALADTSFTPWPTPRLDLGDLADIVAAAGSKPVFAHTDTPDDQLDALAAGVRILAHPAFSADETTVPDAPFTTTLGAFSGTGDLISGELLADDLSHTPSAVVASWTYLAHHPGLFVDGWIDASAEWSTYARHNVELAIDEGRTVVAGSDAGYWFVPHGLGLHREMEALVELGMTPQEALAAATSVPADLLGWEDLGHVAAGYTADLVVVDGRPDQDVTASRNILQLYLDGQPWDGTTWQSAGDGDFCLDDRDCSSGRCDPLTHQCAASCSPPYDRHGSCDAATWCMPADGLGSSDGVCHPGVSCDLYAQDCEPAYYGENCVPVDTDTNTCWPSGPQAEGEPCSWYDPDLYCAQGLFCSWLDGTCYRLCDPTGPDTCPTGRCTQQAAEGVPWFGLCL